MAEREVRIAHTEALFRDVNERIAESADRFNARDAEFVCECADPACAERVPATNADAPNRTRPCGSVPEMKRAPTRGRAKAPMSPSRRYLRSSTFAPLANGARRQHT